MKVKAGSTGDFEKVLIPEGMHEAVCYGIYDFGTQTTKFNNQEKKQRQIQFSFEVPEFTHVFKEERGPQVLSTHRTMTLSLSPKATLKKFLEGWRKKKINEGDEVELKLFLTQPCQLVIKHKDDTKGVTHANISDIFASTANKGKQKTENPPVIFSLEEDEFDQEVYDMLPEWMQKKIADSPEFQALVSGTESTTTTNPAEEIAGRSCK